MFIQAASQDPSLPALILPLVGVVVGASISAGIGLWISRQQRLAAVAAEKRNLAAVLDAEKRAIAAAREADRHGRAMVASAKATDALTALLLLGREPDEERPDEAVTRWQEERRALIVAMDAASLDIDDQAIRNRLGQVVHALNFYHGPERNIRQSEYRTRYLAITDGLACLGAYRRGDDIPAASGDFETTIEFADLYLEELELNSRG